MWEFPADELGRAEQAWAAKTTKTGTARTVEETPSEGSRIQPLVGLEEAGGAPQRAGTMYTTINADASSRGSGTGAGAGRLIGGANVGAVDTNNPHTAAGRPARPPQSGAANVDGPVYAPLILVSGTSSVRNGEAHLAATDA